MNKPAYFAGSICAVFASSLAFDFYSQAISANTKLAVAGVLIISALFFALWPSMRKQDLDTIETLPGTLEEIRKLGREYYRNTSAIQENSATASKLNAELSDLLVLRKPLEELLMHQRQENLNLRDEIDAWQKAIIRHFEYLDRSINLEGLDEVRRESYRKAARDLAVEFKPLGFEVLQPKPGQLFDEHFQEIRGEVESDLPMEYVVSVEGLGFCINGRCVKPVPVIVSKRPIPMTLEPETVTVADISPDDATRKNDQLEEGK